MDQVVFVKDSLDVEVSDKADQITLKFLKAVFHKFHFVHS